MKKDKSNFLLTILETVSYENVRIKSSSLFYYLNRECPLMRQNGFHFSLDV